MFWDSCCNGKYTTRSYNMDGTTNWIRNYYEGAKGLPETGLRCCVDSQGNVYTCGPCAESSENTSTWSLISYDPDGEERWRKDLYPEVAARTPFSSRTARLAMCDSIDVICTDDDRIVLLWNGYSGGFGVNVYNPNGSTSAAALALEYDLPITDRMITKKNVVNLGFGIGQWAAVSNACLWGANNYLLDTGSSNYWNPNWTDGNTAPPYLIGPTVVSAPFSLSYTPRKFKHWGFQWQLSTYIYEFWGVALSPRRDAGTTALCASDDGSQIYTGGFSIGDGNALHAIRDGVGVRFRRGRLTSQGAHALSGGEGQPPRDIPTVFVPSPPIADVQHTLIWGQMTEAPGQGVAMPEGVAFSGQGVYSPRLEYHEADDGSRIWGHNHQMITDMALYRDETRLITIGNYQSVRDDDDFV